MHASSGFYWEQLLKQELLYGSSNPHGVDGVCLFAFSSHYYFHSGFPPSSMVRTGFLAWLALKRDERSKTRKH
jgi:hypothetical protein